MRLIQPLAAILLLLAACSPQSAGQGQASTPAAPARHAVSGLPVIPLSVVSGKVRHQFHVEVAASPAQQEKGLMFRTSMGDDEGMIFPMHPPRQAAFWMRNTVIPLDIVFIGRDRRILNIAANAVPYDETPLPSAGPASGVLELKGGRAAALGIGPGDLVEW
ncbi:MAG: DUF192 domain-containing protein [Novosphingobium sp.]